jgi:CRISPR-associated endonuclease/helicase Cas3
VPTLTFSAEPPGPPAFAAFLADHLSRTIETHPAAWAVEAFEQMQKNKEYPLAAHLRRQCLCRSEADRSRLDWVTALVCETAPKAASQLLTVRRDYLPDNLRSVLDRTTAAHLRRALFDPWDYADALNNQSLHWEPSEDRRHAYQWHQPNGDPTRARRGGMLGANRLALEAWPLFPSFPDENNPERVNTRGFRGNRASNTFWIWPLWSSCLTPSGVASMLSLRGLVPATAQEPVSVRHLGVTAVYRSQRILVNKTPNLTPAAAIA